MLPIDLLLRYPVLLHSIDRWPSPSPICPTLIIIIIGWLGLLFLFKEVGGPLLFPELRSTSN